MRVKPLLHIALVTLAMGAVPAAAGSMEDFDVQKAESWADALAICDVTRFLVTEPNLESEAIIAAMPDNSKVALRRPYFIPPSNFFSQVMRETFERVRKAGLVTSESYGEARLHYAKLMLNAYPYASTSDRVFLGDQMRTCYALAVATTPKTPSATTNTKH